MNQTYLVDDEPKNGCAQSIERFLQILQIRLNDYFSICILYFSEVN